MIKFVESKNLGTPPAGRVGRRTAGRLGGAGRQDGTPTDRLGQETTVPRAFQGIEDNCPEQLFGSTNK